MFLGPLIMEDDIIIGVLRGDKKVGCSSDEDNIQRYVNIRDPWILDNLIRPNVDDVHIVGKIVYI